jgi:hypothetical protein
MNNKLLISPQPSVLLNQIYHIFEQDILERTYNTYFPSDTLLFTRQWSEAETAGRNPYEIFVVIHEGRKPLGKPRRGFEAIKKNVS